MSWKPRAVDPGFKARRESLQARYVSVSPLPDASRLAYLRGPEHVVTEVQIRDLWVRALENPVVDVEPENNIYIHVPFCSPGTEASLISGLQIASPDRLQAWLDRVIGSMETLGPAVESLAWGAVYVGGGTPGILPAPMLEKLFGALRNFLHIRPDAHKAISFDPLIMAGDSVDVLTANGFTSFSVSIDSFNEDVSRAHLREPQGRSDVSAWFEQLYSSGLYDVSCEFVLGLAGATPEESIADIEWLVETQTPNLVQVGQLVPTVDYLARHFGGDLEAFWRHLEPFRLQAGRALSAIGVRHGYTVTMDGAGRYILQRGKTPSGFEPVRGRCYSYSQRVSEAGKPMHLLGFGTSARSQIFGYAGYHGRSPVAPAGAAPQHYAGQLIDLEDEIRTFVVRQLWDRGEVDSEDFKRIFGREIADAIPVAMSAWADDSCMTVEPGRAGLNSESRQSRLEKLLWLVPERCLEHEISRSQNLDISPDGILQMLGDLTIGRGLHGNHSFSGVNDAGHILIVTPERQSMKFRVAPGLDEGAPLRLVLESRPPANREARAALTRAMVQVRGVLRAAEASEG